MSRKPTHYCDYMYDDHYSHPELCCGVRYSDGSFENTCGEPCSWVMGKQGHGQPPWPLNPDGTRFDPAAPDPEEKDKVMKLTAKLTGAQFAALKELMEMVTRDVINRDDYSFFDLLNSEKRARELLVEKDTEQ
jgi:hypothetical protein